jgi:hypothetical protein
MSVTLSNIALLYLMPTVWQMLESSIVIFIRLFSIAYRRVKFCRSDWVGIFTTTAGIILIAISAILDQKKFLSNYQDTYLGIGLVVLSQMIQAVHAVIEDELVHVIGAPPIEVCAFEGIWGLWVYTLIFMPVANVVPESLGIGLFESSLESFKMAGTSLTIGLLVLGYFVAVSAYSQAGVMITALSSANHRLIYESLRPIAVWIIALAIRWIAPDTRAGEKLSWYAFVRAGGFLIVLLGTAIATRMLRVPGLEDAPQERDEPRETGMKEQLILNSATLSW